MADNPVVSVTVNNGSASSISRQVRAGSIGRQPVTITPLPPGCCPPYVPQLTMSRSLVGPTTCTTRDSLGIFQSQRSQGQKRGVGTKLDKVLLKANCKGKLKEFKTFTLRNVDTAAVVSSHDLKKLLKESLHEDISSRDFDIGYMQGSNVIRVCTKEDMSEMWSEVKKQGMLWCDGLVDAGTKANKSGRKGRHVSDEDSDDEASATQPRKKKKKLDNEDKVQEVVDDLKSKHGTKYTVMQLRIWAELIASGLYSNTSDPPSENSMFQRAGGSSSGKKKERFNWNHHCSSTI